VAVPDVALAVIVEAHRELQIARRHELALAHGTRPGTQHVFRLDPTLIDDLDRVQQLLAEIGAPAPVIGERGERRDLREIATAFTVVALDAPERHDEARLHAKAPRDLLQQRAVLSQALSPLVEAIGRHHEIDILLEGERGLRLMPIKLQYTLDRVRARERALHRLCAHALRDRFLADTRE